MARRNKKIVDNYDLILGTSNKKNSEELYKITKKNTSNNKDRPMKKVDYTEENVKETIDNFKKVKKIIEEESKYSKEKIKKIKKKKKKKMNKKFKHFLIFNIFLLVLLIILVILALTLPLFNIKEVYLMEEATYDKDEIASNIGLNVGKNIFISLFKTNTNVLNEKYPYIDKIDFKYTFPNKVGMKIEERKNRYYSLNKEDSNYYILSKDGYILESIKDTSKWKEGEIIVRGITFENKVVLGTRINDYDLEKLNTFERYNTYITDNIPNVKITRVTFENAYMKIYINSSVDVIFKIADSPEKYNMKLLSLVLKDVGDKKGTIDMTKENPTFVGK